MYKDPEIRTQHLKQVLESKELYRQNLPTHPQAKSNTFTQHNNPIQSHYFVLSVQQEAKHHKKNICETLLQIWIRTTMQHKSNNLSHIRKEYNACKLLSP